MVWNLKGHVVLKVTLTGGSNAVVNGLFFGNAPAAATATAVFVETDTAAQGTWKGVYGGDGEAVNGDWANYPAYAQVSISGQVRSCGGVNSGCSRAPEGCGNGPDRIGVVHLHEHEYGCEFDRREYASGGGVLPGLGRRSAGRADRCVGCHEECCARYANDLRIPGGLWVVWNLKGHVILKMTLTGGSNAVVNGLFFGNASAAATAQRRS